MSKSPFSSSISAKLPVSYQSPAKSASTEISGLAQQFHRGSNTRSRLCLRMPMKQLSFQRNIWIENPVDMDWDDIPPVDLEPIDGSHLSRIYTLPSKRSDKNLRKKKSHTKTAISGKNANATEFITCENHQDGGIFNVYLSSSWEFLPFKWPLWCKRTMRVYRGNSMT